jgi:hypothetical protein
VADNVQPYLAKELKLTDREPTSIVRVFRPKDAVAASAKDYDGVPITLDHPSKMVNSSTWKLLARGHAQGAQAMDTGDVEAELLVRDAQTIKEIESGARKELSAAYDFELTLKAGVSPKGEAYDAIASDFEPNHIAVVKRARGRTSDGRVCQVNDSEQGERKMRRLVFDAVVLGTVTGLNLELEDSIATQVEDSMRFLISQRNEAFDSRDAILKECSERLEEQAATHTKAMDSLSASIPALVQERASDMASLVSGAAAIGIKLKTEGKDSDALRREILTEANKDAAKKQVMDAMIPDLSKADSASLTMATNALFALPVTASKTTKTKAHDALGDALAGKGKAQVSDAEPTGRAAMLQASSNAWRSNAK